MKFTDEGEIAVKVDTLQTPGAPTGSRYHVTIRDTGIGIPPDRIDRLFQSFTQVDASTSRRFGGTGLGLAISRRLAELMDGTVTAESSGVPGEGSTFRVTFEAGATDMTPTALRRDGSYAGRRAFDRRRQRDEPPVDDRAAVGLGGRDDERVLGRGGAGRDRSGEASTSRSWTCRCRA